MKRTEIEKHASCSTDDIELLFQQIDMEAKRWETRKTINMINNALEKRIKDLRDELYEQIKYLEERIPKIKEDSPTCDKTDCDKTDMDLNISIEVGKQYIDKQDLLKWCEHISHASDPNDSSGVILKDFVENVIIPSIKMFNTANVKEVRYGEWIPSRDEEGLYVEQCSECDYIERYNIDPNNEISMPYCPKCGAKMTAPLWVV